MNLTKHWRTITLLAAGGLLSLVMTLLLTHPGRAAGPWYVAPGGHDGNDCLSPATPCATINGALGKASSGDTVYVAIGTYTGCGTNEVALLDKSVTLSGGWDAAFTTQSGASIIDGEAARRGMTVNSGVTATVERFTVRNGSADVGGGIHISGTLTLDSSDISDNSADGSGGGIYCFVSGILTVSDSTISGNSASGGLGGGGILNEGAVVLHTSAVSGNTASGGYGSGGGIRNEGILALHNSTISGNSAWFGGGIHNSNVLTVNNSTVSGNMILYFGGGINNGGIVTLNSSTVSGNLAGTGGGISTDGAVTLQNTILSGNAASEAGPDCSGIVDTSGYNLVGNTSGCTFTPGVGDLTNLSARLDELIGIPGTPGYHPLRSESPAIDAGNPTGCTDDVGSPLDTDQRGAARVGRCDIGAYEYTVPGPAVSTYAFDGTPQYAPLFFAFDTPLQAAVLDSVGTPVSSTLVTFSAPASGASGTFADSGTFTTTAVTDEGGIATAATFTTNELAGSYTVTATADGVAAPASFLLFNARWYVAPGGSDASDCLSPATACATINAALAKPGFVISATIQVATGTYTDTGDEVVLLDKDATLSGGWDASFTTQSGTSIIDGEDARRGVTVNPTVTAALERFTIQNGSRTDLGYENGGAGIFTNDGSTLTVSNCVVSGNTVEASGGGIRNWKGTVTLNKCVVVGNTAGDGGGIATSYGTVILNNSTASSNEAFGFGGGIRNEGTVTLNNSTISGNTAGQGGGIANGGTLTLNSSTVSGNTASGDGGGIRKHGGTVTLQNTILAGNVASGASPDCSAEIASSGYNLVGDTSDCTFASTTGDLSDVDAKLFSLFGSPGYHPLRPDSPAIDAGNPAGCTDHLGNPLSTDQRGSPRPLDGDGDGIAICDMGSYEYDPDHPISQVFLPLCFHNYCPDFFDDFSNPASGWEVVDDSYVRTEYLNGEYRILTKQSGYFYLFRAPTCDRRNYIVEADARWVGTPGSSYGLIFGVTSGFEQYYLFDMNTDYKQFRLLRGDSGGFTEVVPITDAPAINGGTASNHLKVTRDGDQITLEVNGTVLGTWTEGTIGGLTGAGLVTNPYGSIPTSDARFDNFSMTSLSGSAASAPEPSGVTAEERELSAPGAWRDPAPVVLGW
jgi:hypothetical protein